MSASIFQLSDTESLSIMSRTTSALLAETSYSDLAFLALSLISLASYYSNGNLWNKSNPLEYKFYERPQLLKGGRTSQLEVITETKNIAVRLEDAKKDGVIFWASQSGRGEAFATRLGKELLQRFKLQTLTADISDYDPESISSLPETKFAIFIMSTYGEGDPPDNGWLFWDWVKESAKETSLQSLQYAAFGLGNSNYRYYNKVIDVIAACLNTQGATELLPTGKADDARGDTEEDFLQWKEDLFHALQTKYHLETHQPQYEPALSIRELGGDVTTTTTNVSPIRLRSSEKTSVVVQAQIQTDNFLTSSSSPKQVLHLEVDLSDHPQLKYKTGDHLALWPTNPAEEVSRLINILGQQSICDQPISISSIGSSNTQLCLPIISTLRNIFQHYLEICAPVSREVVQSLSEFTTSPAIKAGLSALSSTKSAYSDFVASRHITLSRLLEYAQEVDRSSNWSCIPLSFVLENIKPLSPRYYSISSSSSVSPRRTAITVSMASSVLPTTPPTTIPGLTSAYLSSIANLQGTATLPSLTIQIRRSEFKLPASASTPLILIAAGSGIAPIRAFLHERARLASLGRGSGQIILFYGCRHPDQDYLYCEEIEAFANGALKDKLEIITAFSRQEEHKVYVQDRIAEYGESIATKMMDEAASLYVCGSTHMAKAAGDQIVEAVRNYRGFGGRTGSEWRAELKRFKRWQEDVWG